MTYNQIKHFCKSIYTCLKFEMFKNELEIFASFAELKEFDLLREKYKFNV